MNKLTLPIAVLFSLSANAQLTYTPATTGLNTITYEIGFTELESADMNNDGRIDLISIGDHGSPNFSSTENGIMIWQNNGNGTSWTLKKIGSFGYGGVAIGDVNNDGMMDVGYGMHHNYSSTDLGDQLIEVALGNNSMLSWTPYDDGLATNGETYGMFGADFADVNNDGLLDIGANSFGCCAGIHIYKNNGNGTWTQTDGAVGGNAHNWLKFGDFNNDGNTDLMTASDMGQIWKNDGTGFFNSMQTGFPYDWWIEFDLADVNNDGAKDVGFVDSNGNLYVYTYNTTTNTWQSISSGLPATGNMIGVALDDMDMDGYTDVVAWRANNITIYKGNGGTSWTTNGSFSINETQLSSLTTGDYDHDGYADIAYLARANTGDNMLRVYLHTVTNPTLNLLPVFPNGQECFAPNSVQFLSWLSSVPVSTSATVTIDFSQTGPGGPWTTIANSIPNSGTYQWTTPVISSSNCFLRYTITNGTSTQVITTAQPFGVGDCNTVTAVEETNSENEISVYPNPSSGLFVVQSKEQEGMVEVTDIMGKLILSSNIERGMLKLNLQNSSAGIYFIHVQTQNGVITKKVVKQ